MPTNRTSGLQNRRATPPRSARHGLSTLKRAVRQLGGRTIDRRTGIGKALARWRADLIADLGGPDHISTQQLAIIELAARTKLLVESVDAWLLRQPSVVNSRKRALLPVVRERQQLVDSLARLLQALGLERRQRPPLDLTEYLASRAVRRSPEPRESPVPLDEAGREDQDHGADREAPP